MWLECNSNFFLYEGSENLKKDYTAESFSELHALVESSATQTLQNLLMFSQ